MLKRLVLKGRFEKFCSCYLSALITELAVSLQLLHQIELAFIVIFIHFAKLISHELAN